MQNPAQVPIQDDMEKRTRQYIEVRDTIKRMEEEHKERVAPWKEMLAMFEGAIQSFLRANNLDSLKTAAGTCYVSSRTTASLADPDAFMNYVIEHKAFDLMDRRANVTAVKDFVREHKTLPPGCNLSTTETLGVRRGGASSDE